MNLEEIASIIDNLPPEVLARFSRLGSLTTREFIARHPELGMSDDFEANDEAQASRTMARCMMIVADNLLGDDGDVAKNLLSSIAVGISQRILTSVAMTPEQAKAEGAGITQFVLDHCPNLTMRRIEKTWSES